jgi:hypothetical protein
VGTLTLDAMEGNRIAFYLDVLGSDLCAAMLLGDALDPLRSIVEGDRRRFPGVRRRPLLFPSLWARTTVTRTVSVV